MPSFRLPRWVLVAVIAVALAVLGQASLSEIEGQPTLGVRAIPIDGQLVISEVHPAGWGWDAGIRPGYIVTAIDRVPIAGSSGSAAIDTAQTIEARSLDGSLVSASVDTAKQKAEQWSATFFPLAVSFVVIGSIVCVLATDLLAALSMLALTTAAAVTLIAGVASAFGSTWWLAAVFVSMEAFGASLLLLFLVFPTNYLRTSWGPRIMAISLGLAGVAAVLYPLAIWLRPDSYGVLRGIGFAVVSANLICASLLALLSLARPSSRNGPTRHAFALVAIGTLAGLLPLALLFFVPLAVGVDAIVPARVAILSLFLLPASVGAAVLSRQFFGITRLVRRGLVALVVWMGLIGIYGIGLAATARWQDGRDPTPGVDPATAILLIVVIAATFWPAQMRLRRTLECWLFRDVYDPQSTLRQLGAELAQLGELDAVARHVLDRLGSTLDLSWASIALDAVSDPIRFRWGVEPDSTPGPVCTIPLVAEGEGIGRIIVGPKRHDVEHMPADLEFLHTVTPLIAVALRNALLVRELKQQVAALEEREHHLAALSGKLLRVQEDERRRLALDLHDEPLQRAILLARQLAATGWRRGAEEIVESLRAICAALRPRVLDDLGLVAGLEELVSRVRASSDLDACLIAATADGMPFGRLEPDLEVALYRVAQESLNNCSKHAEATSVTVGVCREPGRIVLRVADDGRGPGCAASNDGHSCQGLGLVGMRERLQPWQGVVALEPNEPRGSLLSATVSWEEGDRDVVPG